MKNNSLKQRFLTIVLSAALAAVLLATFIGGGVCCKAHQSTPSINTQYTSAK